MKEKKKKIYITFTLMKNDKGLANPTATKFTDISLMDFNIQFESA